MMWVYVAILGAVLAAALIIFAVVMWFINNREERQLKKTPHYRHDVIIRGGVDITTGQMRKNDHQYFNGTDSGRFDTVCISSNYSGGGGVKSDISHSLLLIQQSTGKQYYGYFGPEIVVGRSPAKDGTVTLVIDNDSFISGNHFKVFEYGGAFYVLDLGSSNHTYLDRRMITGAELLVNGAYLKAGKETYQVFLN